MSDSKNSYSLSPMDSGSKPGPATYPEPSLKDKGFGCKREKSNLAQRPLEKQVLHTHTHTLPSVGVISISESPSDFFLGLREPADHRRKPQEPSGLLSWTELRRLLPKNSVQV